MLKEIRSISRFGLSVVTIVFDDDVGTYLPRQLVAEKLPEVQEQIPMGFGEPSMGPISTGLGEIYQYTLEVDEEHQGEYSATWNCEQFKTGLYADRWLWCLAWSK